MLHSYTRTEWEQVLQSCEHAKECCWPTIMAQKAQDAHEGRHFQIAEQIVPDHVTRVLRDPEYWRETSFQDRNNNLLLSETIRLIEQLNVGGISIIQCGILIGYRERM